MDGSIDGYKPQTILSRDRDLSIVSARRAQDPHPENGGEDCLPAWTEHG